MKKEGFDVSLHAVSKFHGSLFISGILEVSEPMVAEVHLRCAIQGKIHPVLSVAEPVGASQIHFSAQALLQNINLENLFISFWSGGKQQVEFPLQELAEERLDSYRSQALGADFVEGIRASGVVSVLDLGGRDRSRNAQKDLFGDAKCTVFDIVPGDNVDVVGDAHRLSKHFSRGKFDFVYCISVFEHLLMPWKVVIEMNKVMKKGGRALISTHQTVGVHDLPWDFWRFTIWSWEALFNRFTGFKIVDREMDMEQFVIPFVFRPGKEDAEKSAGYEASVVLVEKTGPALVRWWVPLRKILATSYPA